MADHAAEFERLAERFQRVEETLDTAQANSDVWRLAARACKLVIHCHKVGTLPHGVSTKPGRVADHEDDAMAWDMPWVNLTMELQACFPHRLSKDVGVQRGMRSLPDGAGYVAAMTQHDWKQRAEDYADVCRLLADIVRGTEAVSDSPFTIPREYQSRPMSYREAGVIHRKSSGMTKMIDKKAGEWMRKYVDEQPGRCIPAPGYKMKRIFDIRLFVPSVWDDIRRIHESDPKATPKR